MRNDNMENLVCRSRLQYFRHLPGFIFQINVYSNGIRDETTRWSSAACGPACVCVQDAFASTRVRPDTGEHLKWSGAGGPRRVWLPKNGTPTQRSKYERPSRRRRAHRPRSESRRARRWFYRCAAGTIEFSQKLRTRTDNGRNPHHRRGSY